MKVIYHVRAGHRVPDYICDGRTVNDPQPMCQWISGKAVDEAVGDLLLEIVTPTAIEATLAIQQELQTRLDEVERLRKQQVERARYEAELAQRRLAGIRKGPNGPQFHPGYGGYLWASHSRSGHRVGGSVGCQNKAGTKCNARAT